MQSYLSRRNYPSDLAKIRELAEHIQLCADTWDKSGVSRVKTITGTAAELLAIARYALYEQDGFASLAEAQRARATEE